MWSEKVNSLYLRGTPTRPGGQTAERAREGGWGGVERVSQLILLWFHVIHVEKQTKHSRMKNLGAVGATAPLGPSSGVPTSAWTLCMPLPRSPACERNRMPGLLTVPGLFSESQQLPLTELPPPTAQNLPSLGCKGLGPLPSLQMIPLRVSGPLHPVSNSFSFLRSAGDP